MMSSLETEEEVKCLKENIQNLQPLFEELETYFTKTNLPKPFLCKNQVFFPDDIKIGASQKQFWGFNGQPDQHHYNHPGFRGGFQGAQFQNHYQMQAFYDQQQQQYQD
jgi:hypothetical protein